MRIIWRHAFLLFGTLFLSGALIGNLLYMNPFVASLYARMSDHPGIKSWREFGSLGNFIFLNTLSGIFLTILYIVIYTLLRDRLPHRWVPAGLAFGMLVILIKAVPEAWNQFMNINYPTSLIRVQLIISSVDLWCMALILSLAWTRWPAVSGR